jgi:hypothetical protein
VRKLYADLASKVVNRLYDSFERLDVVVRPKPKVVVRNPSSWLDRGGLQDNQPNTTDGPAC